MNPCTWLTVPDWSRKNRGSSSCCHVKKWHGMVEKPLHSWCKSMQTLCWQRSLQPLYFSYARTGKPWNFSCCSRTRMQPWKEPTKPNATVKRRREAGVYPFGREKTIWTHIWDFMVGSTWGFFFKVELFPRKTDTGRICEISRWIQTYEFSEDRPAEILGID